MPHGDEHLGGRERETVSIYLFIGGVALLCMLIYPIYAYWKGEE